MKNLITTYFILFCFVINAQHFQDISSEDARLAQTNAGSLAMVINDNDDNDAFIAAAEAYDIPQRTFEDVSGMEDGYYVVIGVFSEADKAFQKSYKIREKRF